MKKPAFLAQVTTDAEGNFASQIKLSTAQPVMLSYSGEIVIPGGEYDKKFDLTGT